MQSTLEAFRVPRPRLEEPARASGDPPSAPPAPSLGEPAGSSADPPSAPSAPALEEPARASGDPPSAPSAPSLEEDLEKKRPWRQRGLYKRLSGGRRKNAVLGLENRGVAGGWGSNRLYSGMERRRHDWSAAEGVDICNFVQELKAEGTDAKEVNRALLRKFGGLTSGAKGKRIRSLKAVCKKGLAHWKAKLKKVQVGKHGPHKKGAILKEVCKTSEARGCRAPGWGQEGQICSLQGCSEARVLSGAGEWAGGFWIGSPASNSRLQHKAGILGKL